MKIFVTRAKKLTVTITVDEVRTNIIFNQYISDLQYKAYFCKDEKVAEALEGTTSFNAEYWLHEVVEDIPEIEPEPEIQPESTDKDYPGVKTLQEARMILMEVIQGLAVKTIPNKTAILTKAKEAGITFSNLK